MPTTDDVTQLLLDWSGGDRNALDKLMPLVYADLRQIARRYMRSERADHTLQTTALVHEAYVRLVNQNRVSWKNRAHFLAIAAQMMRRILIDHARSYRYQKRGGGALNLSLDEAAVLSREQASEMIALDHALTSLEKFDPRKSRVVELKFFGGLTTEETAAALEVSKRTVESDWNFAQAWLYREMSSAAMSDQ
ncbi:MAG TPA: sigma-70 family RNA polymerase sigma factor [Blastocatellia bacterium]|nr:sigma-70 family RNA polymerase sigma factor [Blastocatellia bacterium]